jgi:hypothetical protein
VPKRFHKRSVRDALTDNRWARDITGAPTAALLADYFAVWDAVQDIQLTPLSSNRFVWK